VFLMDVDISEMEPLSARELEGHEKKQKRR
jgi:hypothetical protein